MRDNSSILYVSFLFKIKFSIIKQDSDTWEIKLILLVITIQQKCISGKSSKKQCQCLCALLGT